MKPPIRVYVDTSVFGGVLDEEFAEYSRRFFRLAAEGRFIILLSDITVRELIGAPAEARAITKGLPERTIEEIPITEEVLLLAERYVETGVLSRKSENDAIHVASATVAGADLILSWNFKHIVRYDRVRKFNGVNGLMGYRPLDIRSPRELDDES